MTGVDLELGGVAIRAGDLPLLRRADGGLRQCVRLAVTAPATDAAARASRVAAGEQRARHGDRRARRRHDDGAAVRAGGRAADAGHAGERARGRPAAPRRARAPAAAALARPPRPPLALRPRLHRPAGARPAPPPRATSTRRSTSPRRDDGFRWTVESNLPLERWLAARPRAARDELLDLAAQRALRGRARCRSPCTPRRCRSTSSRGSSASRTSCGAATASRSSPRCRPTCPGAPPGLPLVLAGRRRALPRGRAQLGVARDAVPDRRRVAAARLPLGDRERQARARLAHGQPARHRVPRGQPARPRRLVRRRASTCCRSTSPRSRSRGYPYAGPHETLGLPEPAPARRIRSTCSTCACRACSPTTPGRASCRPRSRRAWAREYAYPQLVPSTNRDFFERLEERHGAELETFRGDWADWWADGLGSAAREVGFNRRAQAAVRTAQTLHVMADALTGADPSSTGPARPTRVYERMALFDEHTWCAAHPAGDALTGASRARCSGSRRPRSRSRRATARRRCSSAAAALASAPAAADSILVLNPSGHARTDLVELFVPASRVDTPAARGRRRRARRARAARARRRPSRAATGRRAGCSRSSPATCRRSATAASSSSRTARRSPRSSRARSRTSTTASSSTSRAATRSGSLDLELGLDLVDAASAFGFGQVVRDLLRRPAAGDGARASAAPSSPTRRRTAHAPAR